MKALIALALLQSSGYRVSEAPMPYQTVERRLVVSMDNVFATETLPIKDGKVDESKVREMIEEATEWRSRQWN